MADGASRCCAAPDGSVTRATLDRFPPTWRPLTQHPRLRAASWASTGSLDRVVFCERCGALWYLFHDPREMYYTDIVPLDDAVVPALTEDGPLDGVWPILHRGDRLVRGLIFEYFAGARYEASAAASRLVAAMAAPRLGEEPAFRLLLYLRGVLLNRRHQPPITVADAEPLARLVDRPDLFRDHPDRAALGRRTLREALDDVVGLGLGGRPPRLRVPARTRRALLAMAGPEHRRRRARAALPAAVAAADLPRADEALVELQALLWETGYRPATVDIDALLDAADGLAVRATRADVERARDLRRRTLELLRNLLASDRVPSERRAAVTRTSAP
jgi:hypothetical protein